MRKQSLSQPWALDIALIIFIVGLLYFILLGTRPLFVPDEGRYAEIAREMANSGNYITPYLNGIKYFEKPALFYWLAAIAIKIGGLNLWSLRFVNACLALLGCLATYFTAYQLYDRKTAQLSAFILATTMLYFVMGHMINLDLTVSVFLAISLFAFIIGFSRQRSHTQISSLSHQFYFILAAFASALAVLTKGLIGIVFPSMIIFFWLLFTHEWRMLKTINYFALISIFLSVAAPWHMLVGHRNPEFYYFYFIEQHFLRYATDSIGHYQPIWFFIPALIFGLFPWIVFLPQSICKRFTSKTDLFLLIWAISIFVFFSFSRSKLIPYILPVFPPLTILIARYLNNPSVLGMKIGVNLLLILTILISAFLIIFIRQTPLPDTKVASIYISIGSVILLFGTTSAYILTYIKKISSAIKVIILTSGLFLLITLAALPAIDTRTILPLAQTLQPILTPHDEVITFNQYYQDLPFYLNRQVRILNWRNELSFGMLHQQNAHEWLIDDQAFWTAWNSHQRVFVIIANEELSKLQKQFPAASIYVLTKTINNTLISNVKVFPYNELPPA